MVSQALQESLGSLTLAERIDVIAFLQQSLMPHDEGLTQEERAMIRRRDADLDDDPSIGLTWDEVDARLRPWWG